MVELLGPEGVNFFGRRGVNAADPIHDKDVVNLRTLQWFLEKAEFEAITASGGSSFIQIGNQGGGVPVYYGLSGNTQIFNSFSAGTNLGVLPGAAITYYLQPNISVSGLTAQTINISPFSASCNDIVTLDCNGNLAHSAGTTVLFANLSAGTSIEIISGNPKVTIRHTLWETGRTTANGPYSTNNMSVQLQKGGNASYGNFSIVAGKTNLVGGNYSTILNGLNNTISPAGPYSAILGGTGHSILKTGSTITGGKNITIGLSAYTTAVPYLRIANIYQGPTTPFQFLTIDSNGYVYKTGITVAPTIPLTFNNLGSVGSPNGNVYSFQNLGTVYLRNLSGGTNIGLSQSSNYISISVTGLTAPNISAGTATQIISGNTLSDPFTIRHTIWESGRTSTGAYTTATMAAQMQKGDNQASANFVLVAGKSNSGLSQYSTIIGGKTNTINSSSPYSFIGAGSGNTVSNDHSGVILGQSNRATGLYSTVFNGIRNLAQADGSWIGNGRENTATTAAISSVIVGGNYNFTNSRRNFIGNGQFNTAGTNFYATVLNGSGNSTFGRFSTILNGKSNSTYSNYSTILGGEYNEVTGIYSFIGNGRNNYVSGNTNFIASGFRNKISGGTLTTNTYNFIGNGIYHLISGGTKSFIGAGRSNITYSVEYSLIGNGRSNTIKRSTISGKETILNGDSNTAQTRFSSILGGRINQSLVQYSTISNGYNNKIAFNTGETLGGAGSNFGMISILNGNNNIISGVSYSIRGAGDPFPNICALSTIVNGTGTKAYSSYRFLVGGGQQHILCGVTFATIINGFGNSIIMDDFYGSGFNRRHNFIGTGSGNAIRQGTFTSILNGSNNKAGGNANIILQGAYNTIYQALQPANNGAKFSTIINGVSNYLKKGSYNLVSGYSNKVYSGTNSTILQSNSSVISSSTKSTIISSNFSTITGSTNSLIIGGNFNSIIDVTRGVILGGSLNTLNGVSLSSTGNDNDHVFVPYLKIENVPNGGTKFLTIDNNGYVYSTGTTGGGGGGSGTSGSAGSSGSSGANGTAGSSGSSGTSPAGVTSGSSGSAGTSGSAGSAGTSGSAGSSGTSGTSGVDGASGTSGTSGSIGPSGSAGSSGSSGSRGTSGINGTNGTSGSSGSAGTSGVNGGGLIVNNSSYISTAGLNVSYYGNGKSGWNGEPWDVTALNVAYINCGVPISFDIELGDKIIVCGVLYSPSILANDIFEFNLEYFLCNGFDTFTWIDSRGPIQDTADAGTATCFSVEFTNNQAKLIKCLYYLVFSIKPKSQDYGDLKFSYQIYKV